MIPYYEYLKVFPEVAQKDGTVPHEVVGFIIKKSYNLIKAWRIYLGMTQKQVAEKAGTTQAALSQMERTEQKNKTATLEKLALAMKISVEQLGD